MLAVLRFGHSHSVLLLQVGADLLVVALELLVDVEEATRDGDFAAFAPGDRLVVSDHIVEAAVDVILILIFKFLTSACLSPRFRNWLQAVGLIQNVIKSLHRATLLVNGKVTKVAIAAVGLSHVALVCSTVIKFNIWAQLTLVASTLLSLSV